MTTHERRAQPHFRPPVKLMMGAPGIHPRIDPLAPAPYEPARALPFIPYAAPQTLTPEPARALPFTPYAVPQTLTPERYIMNMLLNALFEILATVPALETDVQTAFTKWHNAHGDSAKTAAAVDTAVQLIQAAGTVATGLETDTLNNAGSIGSAGRPTSV